MSEEWMKRGTCKFSKRPGDWYSNDQGRQKRAIAICSGCPVLLMCLEYAVVNSEKWGIWGATTAADRGHARPRRQRSRSKINNDGVTRFTPMSMIN